MKDDTIRKGFGWVIFLDIFGFKAMMGNRQVHEIHESLMECLEEMTRRLVDHEILPKVYVFSDSIFLLYLVSAPGDKLRILQQCIEDTKDVMGVFLNSDLPLRGGVAYGEVSYSSNLLTGRPVIRAVENEQKIPAPLVLLPACEVTSDLNSGEMGLYPRMQLVKLKDGGIIIGKLIYPFPIDDYCALVETRCREYGLNGPYLVAAAWFEARAYILRIKNELEEY